MKERALFLATLFILLVLLLFYPSLGWRLRAFLVGTSPGGPSDLPNLAVENEALRAKIATYEGIARDLGKISYGYPRASVYSQYPFNFKNEFLISAGKSLGVAPGQAVGIPSRSREYGESLSEAVFLGKIDRVFEKSSAFYTTFDSRLELAVRVGKKGVEALLRGGNQPKLVFIAKDAVHSGEIVYLASHPYPYGLAVGEIEKVTRAADGLFDEATLRVSYDLNSLTSVLVFTETPGE